MKNQCEEEHPGSRPFWRSLKVLILLYFSRCPAVAATRWRCSAPWCSDRNWSVFLGPSKSDVNVFNPLVVFHLLEQFPFSVEKLRSPSFSAATNASPCSENAERLKRVSLWLTPCSVCVQVAALQRLLRAGTARSSAEHLDGTGLWNRTWKNLFGSDQSDQQEPELCHQLLCLYNDFIKEFFYQKVIRLFSVSRTDAFVSCHSG